MPRMSGSITNSRPATVGPHWKSTGLTNRAACLEERGRRLKTASAGIIALCASACATMAPRPAFTSSQLAVAQVVEGNPVRFWADDDPEVYARWGELVLAQRGPADLRQGTTLLAISGGADKGAFAAGLLNGWSERGDRPTFDIVTGVSTGALIAPFAFLGREWDDDLSAIYTGITSKDIYRQRVLAGLLGGPSLLDTRPLQRLIARHVTTDLLQLIAVEHSRGRRLLVQTTNLDAQRGVIWDLGAIAASNSPRRLQLFRQVLLASSSIPGGFEPVFIESHAHGQPLREMHVDGGATAGFFVMPKAMLESGGRGGAIQVLYNARVEPQFDVVQPRTFSVVSQSLATVLGELDRTRLADLRQFAKARSIPMSVCAITPNFDVQSKGLFDPLYMKALYQHGLSAASQGSCLVSSSSR